MKKAFCHILLGTAVLLVAACDRPKRSIPLPELEPTRPLEYHALVIGVSDYAGTGWPQLGTARADAEAIGAVLRQRYGFKVEELLDQQASRGNILRALDQLMKLTNDDALLIYFAGHGFYDKQMGEGYWIPHGAQRARMDQPAKEDWLWNSSISRVLDASPARHVLLVADTCYGGSLFRGEGDPGKSGQWYRRAMEVPSRYLITSGNLEPVLDSGIRHSVFAREILNVLQYGEQDLFSASDIAVSIRDKVSELTGQLVRMGPLTSPAHAGGEFIFVRKEGVLPELKEPERPGETRGKLKQLTRWIQSAFVRPRVLACIGPSGRNAEEAALVRNRLHRQLDALGGCILVERGELDTILQEVELSRSGLADRRAVAEIGKLLPASLILFGEIIPVGTRQEIHLRIVDTETSRVLSSASAPFSAPEELEPACQTLAEQIMKTMNRARPLLVEAQAAENGMLRAGWGSFHGARTGDRFEIVTRVGVGTVGQQEIPLGTACLQALGEESAEFQPQWNGAATNQTANLWLKAML